MDKKKSYEPGVSLLIGAGIGGGIAVIGYGITGNPLFFIAAVLGTGIGLSFGAGDEVRRKKELYKKQMKKKKK